MTTDPVDRPNTIPWPPILFVTALGGAWLLSRFQPLPWPGISDTAARIVGYGFGMAGILLAAWALLTFIRAGTNIRPDRAADKLVTTGPFRRFRNPMYLSEVLILLGLAELTHNLWFVILAPVFALLVTWLAILPEERHLEAQFGDIYRDYKSRSRRWI